MGLYTPSLITTTRRLKLTVSFSSLWKWVMLPPSSEIMW